MEVVRQVREEPQTLLRGGWNEVNCGAGGPHEDAGTGAAILQHQIPLFPQSDGIVGGEPVLVIQEDVVLLLAGSSTEEFGDGVSVPSSALGHEKKSGDALVQ